MKTSKYLYILIFILPTKLLVGQGLTNIWITGYDNWAPPPWGNTVTDFSSGSPVMMAQNMNLSFHRTNASISDSNGNLLFYTNGFAVCNALGDTNIKYLWMHSQLPQLFFRS